MGAMLLMLSFLLNFLKQAETDMMRANRRRSENQAR